jgi:predicted DNA-binding transcriptional regulator YafY
MNKVERLTATLLLLQDRPHTSVEIAGRFEVSKRTVLRDVQALCEMGVPVVAREGVGGGYSLPQDYGLSPLPLTTHEAFLLLLALSSLAQWAEVPFAPELASLLAKLRSLLPERERLGAEGLLETVGVEQAGHGARAPFLEQLMAASQQGQWVRVTYASAGRTEQQHLLPQRVSTRAGLWYCQAFSHEKNAERTYRVDRVTALSPAENPRPGQSLPQPTPYDAPEHPQIRAALTARGAGYVESEPHLGQLLERSPDGTGRLALRCPPAELDWYARYFASLGSEVTVEAPAALRQRLATMGRRLVEKYASPGGTTMDAPP